MDSKVVICFQNCIFDLLHTSSWQFRNLYTQLWFAFKIVSLTYFIHPLRDDTDLYPRCDLLSKLYLWLTSYIVNKIWYTQFRVVICFQNCIFDLLHTSVVENENGVVSLWFAFKIVSLTYFIHHSKCSPLHTLCCDLLSKLYLWLTSYIVVKGKKTVHKLWFAFKIVSLTYFIHQKNNCQAYVLGCDLLSKLYLWLTSYILSVRLDLSEIVVICFQNCIFDLLHTSPGSFTDDTFMLWFAFKIVSLTYFIHHSKGKGGKLKGCDLLSKLYLWLTSYINDKKQIIKWLVVICFQNCIFDLLHTSSCKCRCGSFVLWFAFKIVSLTYFIHQAILLHLKDCVVICFQNCIFDLLHTSHYEWYTNIWQLWFAFKIVSLTYFIHLCSNAV